MSQLWIKRFKMRCLVKNFPYANIKKAFIVVFILQWNAMCYMKKNKKTVRHNIRLSKIFPQGFTSLILICICRYPVSHLYLTLL